MIFKTSLLLIVSNLIFIEGISLCCPGDNVLNSSKICLDGTRPKDLECDESNRIMIPRVDNSSTIEHDDMHNLILDDETIPPSQYCLTTMQSKNVEVYVICNDDVLDNQIDMVSREVNTILALVSVYFIVLTITVYCMIPEIFELQEICLIHSISALAVGYVVLAIINLSGYLPDGACHFLAYLMYFGFLYSFFWLNIISFHIWRTVMNLRSLQRIKNWVIIYHIYGIGAPLLALFWVIFVNHANLEVLKGIHPGIGASICWFQSPRETLIFFYAPISVLIVMNILFYVWTAFELWQRSKNCPTTKALRFRLKMYTKLFFVMGLTWIFEVLSAAFNQGDYRWIWIITDILNALQGFIIFLILVVFRKKIKRSLANRKLCVWRLPVHWKNDKDSECEELEEAEMSLDARPPSPLKM